jgi:hypothetical protein
MTIPQIRNELLLIAQALAGIAERIARLSEETRRRKPPRKAPPRPEPKVYRSQILKFYKTFPTAGQIDAAKHFGVNQRAISIALNGKRQ